MAQFLIKAEPHWMELIDRSSWGQDKLNKYNRRTRKGSPIVVMPDNHVWGKEESLPNFVIIKIIGTSVEDVKQYIQPLTEGELENERLIYRRRYHIPEVFINLIKQQGGVVEIDLSSFNGQVLDRNIVNIDT